MTESYNKYQSYRQHFINPNYIHFNDGTAIPSAENLYNPCTTLTSTLLEQRNILRFRVYPINADASIREVANRNSSEHRTFSLNEAEYDMHSKSGVPISLLATKLMQDARYQAYYADAVKNDEINTGIAVIDHFNPAINLSDYQLLAFDKDGFRINDFKSSTWYVINGTLYVILFNCTLYDGPDSEEKTFAKALDLVFLKKMNNRDPIKIGLLEFSNDGENYYTSVVDDEISSMEDLPKYLQLKYENIVNKYTKFTRYSPEFYGIALYLSDYNVKAGDRYFQEGVEKTVTADMVETINYAIHQQKMKNWLFINPYLADGSNTYTINNTGNSIFIEFNIDTVAELNLRVYADYDARSDGGELNAPNLPKIEIPIVRLELYSKFYLYNKNTFIKTEYSYTYNPDKPIITISRDTTVPKTAIENSFNIKSDGSSDLILGQYPNYIPMNWKDPNYIADDDNTDDHIYGRWIDTEDVFVFIDGVKLTPYKDYIVSNEGIIGEDIPAGSILFINRDNPDLALTFPVSEQVPEHNILAFTVPSSVRRNTYTGPYLDNDAVIDPIKPSIKYGDGLGLYPIFDVGPVIRPTTENAVYKIPASMLSQENFIVFYSGRYQRAYEAKNLIVLDNMLGLKDLRTYNDIEYHSYFDDNLDSGVDSLAMTTSIYYPLIENVIKYITGSEAYPDVLVEYMNKYADANFSKGIEDVVPPDRITDDTSASIGSPIDHINGATPASIFELWLRHNTRLVLKHDMDAADDGSTPEDESVRRVPDRQTYFSAGEDLSLNGYKNNIHVSGEEGAMTGMPYYTASNDINNIENEEDETPSNP